MNANKQFEGQKMNQPGKIFGGGNRHRKTFPRDCKEVGQTATHNAPAVKKSLITGN
jgi:hypothetical protein